MLQWLMYNGRTNMYPCDPISFNCMKIRGEASYYYAEIIKKKKFVKEYDFFFFF